MNGLVILLVVVGLSMFGAVYVLSRLRQERQRFTEALPEAVVQVNLLDNDDAVIVSEGRGRLVFANPKARTWFNLNGGEPDLEYMADLVQPAETFLELFSKEGQASFRIGTRRVEATSHYIPRDELGQIVVIMRELTSPNASREMLDPVQSMNAISQIGLVISSPMRLEELLDEALLTISSVIPFDIAEVTLWDEDLQVLYPRGKAGESGYFEAFDATDGVYRLDDSFSGWIARYRQPLLVADTSLRPDVRPKLQSYPLRSYIGVPLIVGERFIGAVELGSKARVAFDHEDLALLQAIAGQIGIAVENARLQENQTERVAELTGLQRIAGVMTALRDARQMYTQLTGHIAMLMNVEMCGILLHDAEQQALIGQQPFHGVPDAIVSMYRITLEETSVARVLYSTRDWWYSNNVRTDDIVQQMGLLSLAEAVGVRTTALVQMAVGERRFGVVQVSNKRDGSGFSENDMRLLGVFASQAAIVVENARLYNEERRRAEELGGLEQISRAISLLNAPEELFGPLTDRIAELMNVQMCGILLYDELSNHLVSRPPFYGVDTDLIRHYRIAITPGNTFYRLYTEQDYWISNELRSDPILRDSGLDKLAMLIGMRQIMMLPLIVGSKRLGVVQVSNRIDGSDFTENDARVLSIFAAQIAVIVENARLYRAMRERAEESESLRRIAELASSGRPLNDIIQPVVQITASLMNVDICAVALLDERTGELTIRPEWTTGSDALTESLVIDTYAPGFHNSVVMSKRPFTTGNLRNDPRVLSVYRAVAERFDFNAAVQVPLIVQDHGVGELTAASRGGRDFSGADIRLLQSVAAQLAAAVDRQQLYQVTDSDLRARIRELDALTRISNELNRTTELERIIDVIRSETERTTEATGATIVLLRPKEEWENPGVPVINRRFGLTEKLPGLAPIERRAILQGAAQRIADYLDSDLPAYPQNARSALAVPVMFSEQVAGVIHLYSEELDAFSTQTQDFAQTVTSQIAIAIGNEARYNEQLERSEMLKQRTEQLYQIFELGGMLRSGETIEDVLEAVAHGVSETIGFRVVVMSLVDNKLQVTRRVAQSGMPLSQWEDVRKVTPALSNLDNFFKPRYQISGSYFLPGDDPEWQHESLPLIGSMKPVQTSNPRMWRDDDLLLVPLRGSTDELIGLMSVDDPRDGLRPTLRAIEALEIFASQAAFAIENFQLVRAYQSEAEATRRERDRLERLHLVTGEIQRANDVPTRLQVVADGIRAAGWRRVAITLRDASYEPLETITSGYTPEEVTKLKANLLPGMVWSQRLSDPEFRNYRIGQAYYLRYSDPWVTENKRIAGIADDLSALSSAVTLRLPTASPRPEQDWHPLDTVYLPIYGLDQSRLTGIISMDSPADGLAPTESTLRPIELFASQAAYAIENTRLYQGMNNAMQQEARINEVMEAITSTLDVEEIVRGMATGFGQLIAFNTMTVALLDDPQEGFNTRHIEVDLRDQVTIEPGPSIPVEGTALGLAARETVSRVYHLDDPEQVGEYADLAALRDAGERTSLIVPMMAGGRVVGALHMGSTLSDAYGFEAQLAFVGRVANLAAVALENAQLLRQTIDRERFATALSRVGQSVSMTLNTDTVLKTVCEESTRILDVDGSYVWLVEGENMVGIGAHGPGANSFRGQRQPLADTSLIAAAVIRNQRPMFANQLDQSDSEWRTVVELPEGMRLRAMLGVPLLREGKAIGAMTFVQTSQQHPFTNADIEKASAFAVQAAIAIDNTRLYQETLGLTSFNESIIQSIQQGIVVLDERMNIRTVNAFMRRVYSWTDEAIGQPIFTYRPNYEAFLDAPIEVVLRTGTPQTVYEVQDLDDFKQRVVRNFYVYPLLEADRTSGLVLLVEDVTKRAALEADIATRAQQLSVLTEISSQLTSILEPEAVVKLVFDRLDNILDFDNATLWLRRDDKLVIRAARGYADAERLIGIEAEIADSDLFREIASRGQVLNIPDITQDRRFPPGQAQRAWLGVSLVSRGSLFGLLVMEKYRVGYYTPTMEQLALTFANQVAVALENATLFQRAMQTADENTQLYRETATRARELDQQARRLSLLYRVSNALTQSLDMEDIFEVAMRETIDMLGVDRGSAWLFQPQQQTAQLVIEYPRGERPPGDTDFLSLTDNELIAEIRQTLQPIILRDVPQEGRPTLTAELFPQRRVLSHIVIPLTVSGQLIGVMGFDATNEYRDFRPEQIEVAQTIASQAAIAAQNANLLEQSLARTRELETLFEATQSISATLNLEEVMQNIALQMVIALQVDACQISDWDTEDNALDVALEVNAEGQMTARPGTRYRLSDYPTRARALQNRQMILLRAEDTSLGESERTWLAQEHAASAIIIPMVVREQAIGLIELSIQSPLRFFTGTEVRLARTLAAQAAVAIENAGLQTETTSKLAELTLLNEMSNMLAATIDEAQIYEIAQLRLPLIFPGQVLAMAVLSDDGQTISYPLAQRNDAPLEIAPHSLDGDEVSRILEYRTPQRLSGAAVAEALGGSTGSLGLLSVQALISVPMISGDVTLGVLILGDTQNPRAFSDDDLRIFSTVGAQLAVGLQNARLFERTRRFAADLELAVEQRTRELQRERDNTTFLYELTTNLTSSLDIEGALNRSLEMLTEVTGAEMGLILSIDNISDSLVQRAGYNLPYPPGTPASYGQREGLAGWVIQTQQSVIVADVQDDYRWVRALEGDDVPRAAMAALLEAGDEIHGVVLLYSTTPGQFEEDQLPLLVAAANQIASAMNNADLYGLIREQAERLGAMVRREQVDSTKNLSIVESIADGVMVANQDGDITMFNSAAERILAIPRRQVIGSHISTLSGLYAASGGQHWLDAITRWTEDPSQHRAGEEVRAQLTLENGRYISVILSPVNMGDQFLGTVSVFRDITREIEVDRMKSEFVATVSHELRTPMTSIKGYADLLLLGAAGPISDVQHRFLSTIKTNADRLALLVNELLDISRIDRGVVRLNLQPINLEEVIEVTVRNLQDRVQSDNKAIQFNVQLPEDLPLLRADNEKLAQILGQLANNAFNYTYSGGQITLSARAEENSVLISVADTGIGISKEKQEHIFDRFFRDEEQPLVMETSGAGLGLSIVKEYVEMHGGQIWLDSEVGQGTTVFVRIPTYNEAVQE